MGRVGFGALNFSNTPAFSAPLQKSFDVSTAHTTPVSTKPVEVPVIETKIVEAVSVSTSTYTAPKEPAYVNATVTEKVEVKEEVLVSSVKVEEKEVRNDYKPLDQMKYKNNPNIIFPEDPADGDNVCISCQ
jgi:hypothetical protein